MGSAEVRAVGGAVDEGEAVGGGPAEIRSDQVAPVEAGVLEVGAAQVCEAEVAVDEVGSTEVRAPEVRSTETETPGGVVGVASELIQIGGSEVGGEKAAVSSPDKVVEAGREAAGVGDSGGVALLVQDLRFGSKAEVGGAGGGKQARKLEMVVEGGDGGRWGSAGVGF